MKHRSAVRSFICGHSLAATAIALLAAGGCGEKEIYPNQPPGGVVPPGTGPDEPDAKVDPDGAVGDAANTADSLNGKLCVVRSLQQGVVCDTGVNLLGTDVALVGAAGADTTNATGEFAIPVTSGVPVTVRSSALTTDSIARSLVRVAPSVEQLLIPVMAQTDLTILRNNADTLPDSERGVVAIYLYEEINSALVPAVGATVSSFPSGAFIGYETLNPEYWTVGDGVTGISGAAVLFNAPVGDFSLSATLNDRVVTITPVKVEKGAITFVSGVIPAAETPDARPL